MKQNRLEDGIKLRMANIQIPQNVGQLISVLHFHRFPLQFCWYSDNGDNDDFYFYSDCQIEFLAQSLANFYCQ